MAATTLASPTMEPTSAERTGTAAAPDPRANAMPMPAGPLGLSRKRAATRAAIAGPSFSRRSGPESHVACEPPTSNGRRGEDGHDDDRGADAEHDPVGVEPRVRLGAAGEADREQR